MSQSVIIKKHDLDLENIPLSYVFSVLHIDYGAKGSNSGDDGTKLQ